MVAALVLIKAETDKVGDRAQALTGIVRGRNNEDLTTVVTDRIRKLPDIAGSETMLAFRTYSKRELEAGFSLGVED